MTTIKLFVAINLKGKPYAEYATGNRYAIIRWIAERNALSPGAYRMVQTMVSFDETKRPDSRSGRLAR